MKRAIKNEKSKDCQIQKHKKNCNEVVGKSKNVQSTRRNRKKSSIGKKINVEEVMNDDSDNISVDSLNDDTSDLDEDLIEDINKFITSLNFQKYDPVNLSEKRVASQSKKIPIKQAEIPLKSKTHPNASCSLSLNDREKMTNEKHCEDYSYNDELDNKKYVNKDIFNNKKGNREILNNKKGNTDISNKNTPNERKEAKRNNKKKQILSGDSKSSKGKLDDKLHKADAKFETKKLKLALQGNFTLSDLKSRLTTKNEKKRELCISNNQDVTTDETFPKIETDNLSKSLKNEPQPAIVQRNSFKQKLVDQLNSGSFRFFNEQLYTKTGAEAYEVFHEDKKAFKIYHEGYRRQLSQWPMNPRSLIAKWIAKKPKNWVVADFGCGDGALAKSIPQKVISLDLVASSPSIIECDMAHTPIDTSSVDVVVFCLSLMGTNLRDYLIEANRVIKENGVLKIAEVESRFSSVDGFIKNLHKYGFRCIHKELDYRYFYLFTFTKYKRVKKNQNLPLINLRPCVYKKR